VPDRRAVRLAKGAAEVSGTSRPNFEVWRVAGSRLRREKRNVIVPIQPVSMRTSQMRERHSPDLQESERPEAPPVRDSGKWLVLLDNDAMSSEFDVHGHLRK